MILALDEGTTGSKALLLGDDGRIVATRQHEFTQHFPHPGWVEHDANEIWQVTSGVAAEVLAAAGARATDLKGVGITNQRETTVVWDRATGEPLHNAIVWQDRRTADRCRELVEAGHLPIVREQTGLTIDPYFSATKIEWLLQNVEGLAARPAAEVCFGTIDSWLAFKLTGRHVTDYSNAARTMLFDINKLAWSIELCEIFGVDPDSLPEVLPSLGLFGETDPGLFGGASIPLAGMAGDQQAALFGQACFAPGKAKNTYGTGSFVLLNVGDEAPAPADGLVGTLAWGTSDTATYAYEASVFVSGAAVQWLRDGLGLLPNAAETETLARSLDSNDGVYFVPALTGLGSPYWDPDARGAIMGLTRGTTRAHLARSALEAMAYQTVDAVRAMEAASGLPLGELHADGGAVANHWLMQFQADVLGAPVVVPEITETTGFGAGMMAGITTGSWTAAEVETLWREEFRFEPQMSESTRAALLDEWAATVQSVRERGDTND
ncbi:MAG: glycerol kinase GlpK [Solirubrobacterales bacterium]|nr:glycerol kinase GlpK [Solirubrobacterales bacterium]